MEKLFIVGIIIIPTGVKITLNNGDIYRCKSSFCGGLLNKMESLTPWKDIEFTINTSGDFKYISFPEQSDSNEAIIAHLKKLRG